EDGIRDFHVTGVQTCALPIWSLVHAKQGRMLRLLDEVGGAYVSRQHAFLDQPVRLVANARDDLFDAAAIVADDLRLHGLQVQRKIGRASCRESVQTTVLETSR